MSNNQLNAIAVQVIELWMLLQGFVPVKSWDANDISCYRERNGYSIWIVSAHSMSTAPDRDQLWESFALYITSLRGVIHFEPFNVDIWSCERGAYISAAIYR